MTKEEIYAKLPQTRCSSSCCKCCSDIIQFSRSEEAAMGGYKWDGKCSHLVEGKCAVYENRPFVCRLFGASVLLKCDGCICDEPLGEDETRALIHEYIRMKKDEEGL